MEQIKGTLEGLESEQQQEEIVFQRSKSTVTMISVDRIATYKSILIINPITINKATDTHTKIIHYRQNLY